MDYSNIQAVKDALEKAQDADRDMRDNAREAERFLDKRDGQWEPEVWKKLNGSPRYTFDKVGPIVNNIAGAIKRASFDSKVRPMGSEASKETAKIYDGLVRNIESISNAVQIYNSAAKRVVTSGINGWMVEQKYIDGDSFDQDLVVSPLSDFIDRVWFDPSAIEQDMSDAEYCYLLTRMSKDDFKAKYPQGSGQSVGDDRQYDVYYDKAEAVTVARIYYKKKVDRELVRMTNGSVYVVDENYEKVRDELAQIGVTEDSRRNRSTNIVCVRTFDGSDWLDEEPKETVFTYLPIIPAYANFKITEGKPVYRGVVEKLMDQQRVYNYVRSRQVAEGALAPRAKYWLTEEMAAGHEDELETLNTNNDAVQYFNPDSNLAGYVPQQNGGAQVNAGLEVTAGAMSQDLQESSGLYGPNMGEQQANQSGFAIELMQEAGGLGTTEYFESMEIAISHTTRVMVSAIPNVYKENRGVRLLSEDGSFTLETINQRVADIDTDQVVTLNDLSKGSYDVICAAGKSYANRQQETLAAIEKLAPYDPTVIAEAGDIIYNSIEAPSMDMIAERKREGLLKAGAIPFEQMTEEEQQQAQMAAQQPPQPDAMMVAAQAEMAKAQAENDKNQLNLQKQQQDFMIKQEKAALELQKEQLKFQKAQADFIAQQQQQEFANAMTVQKQRADLITQALNDTKTEAETLKVIREAMGVDAIVGPNNQAAYVGQAQNVNDAVQGTL